MNSNPVSGKTLRFKFEDGPMAGKSIEHTFDTNGTVRFREGGGNGNAPTSNKYEAAEINEDISAVSYLGSSGQTMTVVLDSESKKLVAFSSTDKVHTAVQHGTFEEIDEKNKSSEPVQQPPQPRR